ncbi:MAG: hypothetical protein ACI4V1_09135 [Eubacteriales bacterium]
MKKVPSPNPILKNVQSGWDGQSWVQIWNTCAAVKLTDGFFLQICTNENPNLSIEVFGKGFGENFFSKKFSP